MTSVYFAGQTSFGNRGCEALIRANVKTLRSVLPEAGFLVPTRDAARDQAQWPDAAALGVRLVPAEPIPQAIRWWSRARRVLPPVSRWSPGYRVSAPTQALVRGADAFVMTGGDIISLDYGLESLHYWARLCEFAMDQGIPTMLWGGSVGPFAALPHIEPQMQALLRRFSLITVRETASLRYLQGLGLGDVELVTDPAFALDPEPAPADCLGLFDGGAPVLGFNVSPLILKFRGDAAARRSLEGEVVDFLDAALREDGLRVLLVPHVDPLDGTAENSDSAYMAGLLQRLRAKGWGAGSVDLLPRTLNAAQLKDVLGRCAFVMAARTHATIAALSQGVPTTSIAYSVKANGINQDLFGHLRHVLQTPELSRASLTLQLLRLRSESEAIRAHLAAQLPDWRSRAYRSAERLRDQLARRAPGDGARP
jgi:polysaccharide pyruvyl transferase WcaK-like protein